MKRRSHLSQKKFFALFTVFLLLSCAWFGGGGDQNNNDQPGSSDGEPLGPLPPAVVETAPLVGSELTATGTVTFYFNQSMDQASVQSAVTISPAMQGVFEWPDPATMVYKPAAPWEQGQTVEFTFAEGVLASNGLALQESVSFTFTSPEGLQLAQALPTPDTFEVDPTSAVVASFNRPVVPLGADLSAHPAAFAISPSAEGRGEWVNTSTYIFYPEPGLTGGQLYTVRLNQNLQSTQGTTLTGDAEWSFMTAVPNVVEVTPLDGSVYLPLDQVFSLEFNQPMDTASVEQFMYISASDGTRLAGEFEWDDANTEVTFTPDQILDRGSRYVLTLEGQAKGQGGTAMGETQSFDFISVGNFEVLSTRPINGDQINYYGSVQVQFYSRINEDLDLSELVSIQPEIIIDVIAVENQLSISGAFEPGTEYTITISDDLEDAWGASLSSNYQFSFNVEDLPPGILVPSYIGGGTLVVDPDEPLLSVHARSVSLAQIQIGALSFEEFVMIDDFRNYNQRQIFRPASLEEFNQPLQVAQNQTRVVDLSLTRNGGRLTPGLYWFNLSPDVDEFNQGPDTLLISSYVNLLTKVSGTDVFVWAVDQRTGAPVTEQIITFYDWEGNVITAGLTDGAGIFHGVFPEQEDYNPGYVVMDSPGEEFFSLATLDWALNGWYGVAQDQIYVYTDRPIYRPGDTVHFRGVVRHSYYGEHTIPSVTSIPFLVSNYTTDIAQFALPVSEFGTVVGSFTIPESTAPGGFSIIAENGFSSTGYFEVAEYRKPEIDLQVDVVQDEILPGQTLTGLVNSRYFFDAPVSDLGFSWTLSSTPSYFSLPGYAVGPVNSFYDPYFWPGRSQFHGDGQAVTDARGEASVELEADATQQTRTYTFSIYMADESGFPINAADTVTVHPAPFYIGIKSNLWFGRILEPFAFEGIVVDWDKNPVAPRTLTATVSEVKWTRQRGTNFEYTYLPEYTLVNSDEITTGDDGTFNFDFSTDRPGVYLVEVSGGGALTQNLVWVGGLGQALWPTLDNGQITLIADKESYQVGDIAQVFIPNSFGAGAQALITVERGQVFQYERFTFEDSSSTLPFEITEDFPPNAYVTVTLLGREPDGSLGYRYGFINLPVDPEPDLLNVEVLGEPSRVGPGETTQLTIQVTDNQGSPVRGEFSVAVVDEAIFALSDPLEAPIEEFFYDQFSVGVQTGISMYASATRLIDILGPGGVGGGGGDGGLVTVRGDFKDTAFWSGSVVTDTNGTAVLEVRLPDNLTTWRVTVRGLTTDTKVGEGVSELITTKPLIIRPVTPRFFVAGDHAQIAAVINNTSDNDLQVEVAVVFEGFAPDDSSPALQTVSVPANGRTRVEWWGTIQDVDHIGMIFSAEGGGLQDLTTPESGDIPVLRYVSPQTFSTSGTVDQGGERLEVISLPRSFDPTGGSLQVQLSPTLAGTVLESLDALDDYTYDTNEYTASRLLSNIETYLILQQAGLNDPVLQARLQSAVAGGIIKLQSSHNFDGGWGWSMDSSGTGESDPYFTAYVLLCLTRARDAGYQVADWIYDGAVAYLNDYLFSVQNNLLFPWEYDRAVFIHYVLAIVGIQNSDLDANFYEQRTQLNPWSQALLGLSINNFSPGDQRAQTLFSDLQANSIRTATGVHWQDTNPSLQNMSTAVSNTALITYALAQYDPASALIPDAVRYLVAHRDVFGMWGSSYATNWTVLALGRVMSNTGELESNYGFSAELNNIPFVEGQSGGSLAGVSSEVDIDLLFPKEPNQLIIRRDPGEGRLYYSAALQVYQPVSQAAPLNRGLTVTRQYYPADQNCAKEKCTPIESIQAGDLVKVKVIITAPYDMYYLNVEDHIPAGSEIVNRRLKAYQFIDPEVQFDDRDPFDGGWGWWWFASPTIYDDRITWMADYLPAGTYELEYTLVTIQPGEYQVIPARAWQLYFPEVQGASAGELFSILP